MKILSHDLKPSMVAVLAEQNHVVENYPLLEDLLSMAKMTSHDALLLDAAGPMKVRRLRTEGVKSPIYVLQTNRKDSTPAAEFLDAGADDYSAHGTELAEINSRIKAIVRRSNNLVSNQITVGAISVDLDKLTVTVNGDSVILTRREFQILSLLMQRADRVVSKTTLFDVVYHGEVVPPQMKTLDVFMCKLRAKLGDNARGQIQTLHGQGYKLTEQEGDA